MGQSRVTIIAELKDYLTGPAKKAKAELSALGRAAEDSSRRAGAAAGRAATASESQARRTGASASRMEAAFQRVDGRASRMAAALGRASGDGATAVERGMGRAGRALGRLDTTGAASRFGAGMRSMADHATHAASRIESAMGRAGKAVGLVAAGVATASVVGGANRLMALESADVKLGVMGYDEGARKDIMGTVDQVVTGTPFSLDAAATGATQYLAAGVKPEDLGEKLGTTVDMAALYDMELGDASLIMSKILATGTLQGDEVMQLQERGMPVYKALAEHLGVDQGDVKGLISKGKVTADEFFTAIQPTVEGGAAKLGDTFKGTFANLRTAFTRGGAAFLTPLMGPVKDLMRGVTAMVKDATPYLTALGERLAPGLEKAAEYAPALVEAFAPLAGPLLDLVGAAGDALPGLVAGLAVWGRAVSLLLAPVLELAAVLLELAGPVLPVLVPLILLAGQAFTVWRVVSFLTGPVGKLVGLLGGGAQGAGLAGAMRAVASNPFTWVVAAVIGLGYLYDNVEPVRDAFDELTDSIAAAGDKMAALLGRADEWVAKKFGQDKDKFAPIGDLANEWFGIGESKFDKALEENTGRSRYDLGVGWVDDPARWGREQLGVGEFWGSGEGAFRMLHGSGSHDEDGKPKGVPAHAAGGWTGAGAHLATVGEKGPEYVVNHWASRKIAATTPGALEHANRTGELPTTLTPVPVGAAGSADTVVIEGDTLNVSIHDARDPESIAAHVRAVLEARDRAKAFTYATPTARGAR